MALPILTTLGLCAGVGMLDLGVHIGLERLGFHSVVLGYVERDAYAAACLLERMEEQALEPAPVWAGNLEDVRWEQFAGAVDCIVAGFPCQPHSQAGSRKGTDDDRWIWPAISDCIRMVRPSLVFLENVAGLRSSGGMAPVLEDLAALGFCVEWDSIRASDCGAKHQRERIFFLAHNESIRGQSSRQGNGQRRSSHARDDGEQMGHARLQHQQLQQRTYGTEYPRTNTPMDDADGAEWRQGCIGGGSGRQGNDGERQENRGTGISGSPYLADASGDGCGQSLAIDASRQSHDDRSAVADAGQLRSEGREQQSAHDADGARTMRISCPTLQPTSFCTGARR